MRLSFVLASLLLFSAPSLSWASPGAHGPNGEHLDGPAAGAAAASDGRPRMEAFTELFEMVAHLERDALTAMISVYETNAPVDGADVELESDGLKAKATFDPATGVYTFKDPKLIASLSRAGKHSVAFTVTQGDDFDIVAGALDVKSQAASTATGGLRWWHVALVVLVALSLVYLFLRTRNQRAHCAGVRP